MNTIQLADVYQMAVPNLTTVTSTVLTLLGTLFSAWMAVKIFHAWGKRDFGAMFVEAAAGVVVAFFVFAPDPAIAMLKSFAVMIFGGEA